MSVPSTTRASSLPAGSPTADWSGWAAAPARWISRARAVPPSLPAFWFVSALTLLVAHYQIWQRFNVGYRIIGALVVLMMPVTAGLVRMLGRPAVIWLLVFEAVMVVNMLMGRYLTPGDLLATASHPVQLLRCLPLMLCGYTLAKYPRAETRFMLGVAFIYWLFSIPEVIGFVRGAQTGLGRNEQYAQTFGYEDLRQGEAYVGAFIYFTPLLLFFAISLMRLYPLVSRKWVVWIIVAQLTFLTVALLSGFGAVLAVVVVALCLTALLAPVKTLRYRLGLLTVAGGALVILDFIRNYFVGFGGRGAVSLAFLKVSKLIAALFSENTFGDAASELEFGSSYRTRLIADSFRTFLENPVAGHGLAEYGDLAVGGHSFIADSAAIFGLIGLVPITAFFGYLLIRLWRARKADKLSWAIASSQIFVLSFIFGNIVNPYFLGMLSLSYFEFFFLGLALADGEIAPKPAGAAGVVRAGLTGHRPPGAAAVA